MFVDMRVVEEMLEGTHGLFGLVNASVDVEII